MKEQNDVKINLVAESCCKTPSKYCAVSDHPSNINYNVSIIHVNSPLVLYCD